ncbi:MAG: hypothetical protein AAGE65_03520 [Planctomycetota bacterium]
MTTKPAETELRLPGREALAEMALARMGHNGIRAVELDRPTLVGLCVRLAPESGDDVRSAWAWLNEQLGGTDEAPAVDDNVVYRFKDRYRPTYAQVLAEEVRRVSKLAVDRVNDGRLTRVNRGLLSERVAERLLDANADVGPTELIKLAAIVRDSERTQIEQRELEAKLTLAEQRTAKLEAEVERLALANAATQRSIEAAKKTVQSTVDAGSKSLDADDVIAILDRVMKGEAA